MTISLDIMKDVFPLNTSSNYNNRKRSTFYSRTENPVYNGTESLLHLAAKIWKLVPNDIKVLDSLSEFKNEIKFWKPLRWFCRILETFYPEIGFV